jgi:hypothetical protein
MYEKEATSQENGGFVWNHTVHHPAATAVLPFQVGEKSDFPDRLLSKLEIPPSIGAGVGPFSYSGARLGCQHPGSTDINTSTGTHSNSASEIDINATNPDSGIADPKNYGFLVSDYAFSILSSFCLPITDSKQARQPQQLGAIVSPRPRTVKFRGPQDGRAVTDALPKACLIPNPVHTHRGPPFPGFPAESFDETTFRLNQTLSPIAKAVKTRLCPWVRSLLLQGRLNFQGSSGP